MQNKKVVLISLVALVLLFLIGGYSYKKNEESKQIQAINQKKEALIRPYSLVLGNKDAKVTLVEFFDPACETCALFHPYVKELMKKHDGKIKLVLRYAPFHKGSDRVVKTLEALKKQDKFIEALEILYITQKYWVQHHVVNYDIAYTILEKSKLFDMNKLNEDLKDRSLDLIVAQDLKDSKILGANKTPSFFVNARPLNDFGLEQLIQLVNEEINKNYK